MNSNFENNMGYPTIHNLFGLIPHFFYDWSEIDKLYTVSDVTGLKYQPEDSVYFKNAKQSASYVLWGAKLLDVFPTSDKVFVFVFSKEDHEKYKVKWNNHEE